MTPHDHRKSHSVRELREAFDRTFAAPVPEGSVGEESFLAIRVAGDPYALRVNELSGLLKDIKIVPVPSRAAEFLGIAGHRGKIFPVYDIGSLLRRPSKNAPRWLALTRTQEDVSIGLAFDEYEKYLKLSKNDLASHEGTSASGEFVRDAIRKEASARPILSINFMIETILQRIRLEVHNKE